MPNLKRLSVIFAALVMAITSAACGGSSSSTPTVPADAVAVINGTPILKSDFDHLIGIGLASLRQNKQTVPKPGTPEYETLKQQAVSILFERLIFRQEAQKDGIAVNAQQVKQQITAAIQQAGGPTKWAQQLAASAATNADYQTVFEIQQLGQKLYTQVTKQVAAVTAAEIVARYNRDKATTYAQPASRKVQHILFGASNGATPTPAQYKIYFAQAEKVLKLALGGADFTALVKQYSVDPGKTTNNGIYNVTPTGYDPAFTKASFALKTGEITPTPVKSAFGYHIIKALADPTPPTSTPLAAVEATIKQTLLQEKQQAAAAAWLKLTEHAYLKNSAFAPGYSLPPGTGGVTTGSASSATT
jgi:parvulin-like peptidyl-prolyl isomerase